MKRTGTKKGVGVGKIIKLVVAVMMCMVVLVNFTFTTEAAKVLETTTNTNKQYTNIYSMYTNFTVTEGCLWWKEKVKYSMEAKFNSAKLIMVQNLSGLKYWAGSNSEAQEVKIGVSKQVTIEKTTSIQVCGKLKLSVPIKAVEVAGELGGSYTNTKTFQKTLGTSSEYTINRSSKAGYYAVIACIEADVFDVKVTNNNTKKVSNGKMLKYSSSHLIERLYRKNSAF